MDEFAGFDLDRTTERAWSAFQSRLADHVAAMEDDEVLLVEAESASDETGGEGCAPYVQFRAWGGDLVRAEVSGNDYLADGHRIDADGAEALTALGWLAPTHGAHDDAHDDADDAVGDVLDTLGGSSNFHLDRPRNHADQLAVLAARALRDVFGVAHPAFLSSEQLRGLSQPAVPVEAAGEPDEPLAVVPADHEHLRSLVDQALVRVVGRPPEHDEDDDVAVVNGSGLVWVRVLDDAPVVQLFSALVCGVRDRERAAFEVAVLNRDVRLVTFVLTEDTVMARVFLPALPFAPLHLRSMLEVLARTVDRVDDDLVARVGGRRAFELSGEDAHAVAGEVEDWSRHPAVLALQRLAQSSPGVVDPERACVACDLDRALVLTLLGWNGRCEATARRARDEAMLTGDAQEVAAASRGVQAAERLTDLLSGALRVLVERDAARDAGREGAGREGAGREGAGRRSGRSWDEALPGLDDGEPGLWEQ